MKRNTISKTYTNIQSKIITKIWIEYNNTKMEVNALWDTGSEICIMSPKLAKKLGFVLFYAPQKNNVLYTIDNKKLEYIKYGALTFYINKFKISNELVTTYELTSEEYDILIGMPIISKGNFSISSNLGFTTFKFKANTLYK